jgi:hypothetical protein
MLLEFQSSAFDRSATSPINPLLRAPGGALAVPHCGGGA